MPILSCIQLHHKDHEICLNVQMNLRILVLLFYFVNQYSFLDLVPDDMSVMGIQGKEWCQHSETHAVSKIGTLVINYYTNVVINYYTNVAFLMKQLHTGINSQTMLDKLHQKNPLQISTGKCYHDLWINAKEKTRLYFHHELLSCPSIITYTCMKSQFECIICMFSKVISTLLILHNVSFYFV